MKAFLLKVFVLMAAASCFGGEAIVPKFTGSDLPDPPQQHAKWVLPQTDLPTNLISAITFLFDAGMADPRGCEYREYEAVVGWLYGSSQTVRAHGWVFPAGAGRGQYFAVSWTGTVYPAIRVGAKADLKHDVAELIQIDEGWRKRSVERSGYFFRRDGFPVEITPIEETNMTSVKVAMLLRLGETELAQEYWNQWVLAEPSGITSTDPKDPITTLAPEWAWAVFNRAVCAHMRGDDGLALADCRKLTAAWPRLEDEVKRSATVRWWREVVKQGDTNAPYFDFLQPLPVLLADEERRVKEPAPPPSPLQIGLDKFPDKSKRIAALILSLDQVSSKEMGFPTVVLKRVPTIKAFIAQGDDAVEPLLDRAEHDKRLTRSVSFLSDPVNGNLLTVGKLAELVLDQILTVSFKNAADYRAYWNKHKQLPLTERWYETMRDDTAGRELWMQTADNILSRTDGTNVYSWRFAPRPNVTNGFNYTAESLRSKRSPSVADLLARRALEIAPTNYRSSQDCWTFDDAAKLGLMLAEWDPVAARPVLGTIIRRCPALFPDITRPESWSTGCAVVPKQLAALADAMAALGDTDGLDLYAKWISTQTPENLRDALPGVVTPLGRYANNPSIREASARLFSPARAEWLQRFWPGDILESPLVLNPEFRALVMQALSDKSEAGTIVLEEKNQFSLHATSGDSEGGLLEPDSFAPKIGGTNSFRVCDYTVHRLSRVEGLPALQLYWPESKRDEAVAAAVHFLQEHGNELKLRPLSWPYDTDG